MKGLIVSTTNEKYYNDRWGKRLHSKAEFDYLYLPPAHELLQYLKDNVSDFIILQGHGTYFSYYCQGNGKPSLQARDVWEMYQEALLKKPLPRFVWLEMCGAMNRVDMGFSSMNWVAAFSQGSLLGQCIGGLHHIQDIPDWQHYIMHFEEAFVYTLAMGKTIEDAYEHAAQVAEHEEKYITILGDTDIRIVAPSEPEPPPPPPPPDDLKEFILGELKDIEEELDDIKTHLGYLGKVTDDIAGAVDRVKERIGSQQVML